MTDRLTIVRNVAIILLLAALVDLVPGGGRVASVLVALIWIAFLALIVWVGARLYRRHEVDLYSLGTRHRAVLYSAIGVVVVTLTAGPRLRQTSLGTATWVALLAASGYAIFAVYRSLRQY